jgi:beta-xylosidase
MTSTYGETIDGGNFANWITEIDIVTGNSLTESRLLHTTTVPLDLGYPLTEASHLYKFNGVYYMMTADSGTEQNHKANIYRSQSLLGPWEGNPYNPVLWNGKNMSNPILSTGHADLVQAVDGSWWSVFLATRPNSPKNSQGRPQLGRETFLCPVTWIDGWPKFNDGNFITANMPGLYNKPREKIWRDDFNGRLADKNYYSTRTPCKSSSLLVHIGRYETYPVRQIRTLRISNLGHPGSVCMETSTRSHSAKRLQP